MWYFVPLLSYNYIHCVFKFYCQSRSKRTWWHSFYCTVWKIRNGKHSGAFPPIWKNRWEFSTEWKSTIFSYKKGTGRYHLTEGAFCKYGKTSANFPPNVTGQFFHKKPHISSRRTVLMWWCKWCSDIPKVSAEKREKRITSEDIPFRTTSSAKDRSILFPITNNVTSYYSQVESSPGKRD